MTPRLLTTRLALDPLRVEDAEELAAVLADPALYTFIGGEPPSAARLQDRFTRMLVGPDAPGETWHNWTVRRLTDEQAPARSRAVGTVQATVTDGGRAADIAWVIGTGFQRQGFATEAAAGMTEWLLASGVTTLAAHLHPDHTASAGVARRLGLSPSGTFDDEGEQVWRLAGADTDA